jgi:hypothetical protein
MYVYMHTCIFTQTHGLISSAYIQALLGVFQYFSSLYHFVSIFLSFPFLISDKTCSLSKPMHSYVCIRSSDARTHILHVRHTGLLQRHSHRDCARADQKGGCQDVVGMLCEAHARARAHTRESVGGNALIACQE